METTTRKTGSCSHRYCTDKVVDRVRSHHEQFSDGGADHGDSSEDKEQMRAASLPHPNEKDAAAPLPRILQSKSTRLLWSSSWLMRQHVNQWGMVWIVDYCVSLLKYCAHGRARFRIIRGGPAPAKCEPPATPGVASPSETSYAQETDRPTACHLYQRKPR